MVKAKSVASINNQALNRENARIIAQTRLEEMYRWEDEVANPYNVQGLHNLRIAAKRLRYTLEIFDPVLPDENTQFLREIEKMQEELGALHDSDVMISFLRLCVGSSDAGLGYQRLLSKAHSSKTQKGRFVLNPGLLASVLPGADNLSAQARLGIEQLLGDLQQQRPELYQAFRQHWYALQGQDFQRRLADMLYS